MSKITKIIVVVLVLILAFFLLNNFIYNEKQSDDTEVKQLGILTLEGMVTGVDVDQMTVDGPGIITFVTELGETYNIKVPSMGINLCVAKDNIADVYSVEVGDEVSVRGVGDSAGFVSPCEGQDDYLRINKPNN